MDEMQVVEAQVREIRWHGEDTAWVARQSALDDTAVLSRNDARLTFSPAELPNLLSALRLLGGRGPAPAPVARVEGPSKRGRAWTPEADAELAAAFEAGEAVTALAERFERTRNAITARLIKLGRMEDDGSRRWPR